MRARVAAALVVVATAALLSPSPAEAEVVPSTPLGPLPASAAGTGGPGTPALEALVAHACNADSPLAGDAWFALPSGDLGNVYARAHGVLLAGRSPSYMTSTKLALVDTAAGTATCGAGPQQVAADQPTDLVVWYSVDEYAAASDCTGLGACDPPRTDVFVATTSGAPTNDTMAEAGTIPSVPASLTGDSGLATQDGPLFHDECTVGGAISPTNYGTVWWRWTAPADGLLHAALPTSFPLGHVGLVDASDPSVAVDPERDADGCPTGLFPVTRQHTYLLAVHAFADEQGVRPLQTGGPFRLDVDLDRVPEPVASAFARPVGGAGIALSWQPPPLVQGAGPVTGYQVSVVAHGSAATPVSIELGADVRAHTFTGLESDAVYDVAVRARNERGLSLPVVRIFSLADAAQYGQAAAPPGGVRARRGGGRVTLTWTPPSYEGSSPVTGYRVRTFAGSSDRVLGTYLVRASVRALAVPRLANGVPYSFDVTSLNKDGAGKPSARTRVVVPTTTPGPPASVRARSGVPGGRSTAVVRWTSPKDTGGAAITGYVITVWRYNRSHHLIRATTLTPRAATTRWSRIPLAHGWYRFTVRATNARGTGATTARSNLVVAR